MSCFTDLTYAMYADHELPVEETGQVEQHLAGCAKCRALVEALRGENRVLTSVLREVESEAPVAVPRRSLWRNAAWTGLGVVLVVLIQHVSLERLAPTDVDWLGFLFEVVFFLALNAGTVGWLVSTVAAWTMVALAIVGGMVLIRRPAQMLVGLVGLLVLLGLSSPTSALETRWGTTVIVAAGETVDGTLVASGDTVQVDGTIDGDLIAGARVVEIRGAVRGDLILGGKEVQISGTVEGNVYTFAGTLGIRGHVTRSVYGFNRATVLERESRVDADLSVIGRSLEMEGAVGRSVWIFGATSRVRGAIGRDLIARVHRLDLLAPAKIGGNVTAHVQQQGDVRIEPEVTIAGARETHLAPPGSALYAEPKFYFWMGTNLFGALLLGFVALVVAPRFLHGSVEAVENWWRTLGLGFAVLVAGPLVMIVMAITLVGLPIALISLTLYLLGLYAAKIVVGCFIGRALLRSTTTGARTSFMALLVGLLLLTLGFELPWVGNLIHLVVFCLGLGAFTHQLYRGFTVRG